MQILEIPGELEEPWTIQHRCSGYGNGGGGCNALLLVGELDLRLTTPGHFNGNGEPLYVTFTCPVCLKETDLPQQYVPESVYERVKNNHKDIIKDIRPRR